MTEIAQRSRGTPRVTNRLLKRVRDFAQVRANGVITEAVAHQALALMEVDELGLDEIDRKVLRTIIEKFGGGPVGLDTIAAAISEEADTIMDVYEPYLLQLGFLDRTPRDELRRGGRTSIWDASAGWSAESVVVVFVGTMLAAILPTLSQQNRWKRPWRPQNVGDFIFGMTATIRFNQALC